MPQTLAETSLAIPTASTATWLRRGNDCRVRRNRKDLTQEMILAVVIGAGRKIRANPGFAVRTNNFIASICGRAVPAVSAGAPKWRSAVTLNFRQLN